VVSEAVHRAAGVAPGAIRDIAVDGRSDSVRVSVIGSV